MGSFPDATKIWTGGEFKLLGSGIKYRKIAFFNIQVRLQLPLVDVLKQAKTLTHTRSACCSCTLSPCMWRRSQL